MMKRPIKYRAWDKDNHVMIYPSEVSSNQPVMTWLGGNVYKDGVAQNYIMLQFTGLYDMNGEEIYDGDILKYVPFDDIDDQPEIYEVQLIGYGFEATWVNAKPGYSSDGQLAMQCVDEDMLVIGNKYENNTNNSENKKTIESKS